MGASIRLGVYKNVRVDRIKVEVWMKIGMFKQALCEEVSLLHEYFMGVDIMYDWGTSPIPSIVKSKPVDKILMQVTVRNVKVDGLK